MMPDAAIGSVLIDELLADLGFRSPAPRLAARAALEAGGLTNPRKQRISTEKRDAVRSQLAEKFVVVCTRAACRDAVAGDKSRTVVDADRPTDCGVCGGRQNRAEVDRAVAVLVERGMRRVVVVGGSPGTHDELRSLVAGGLELRLVAGTERRTSRDAKADLAWADLVVVWGGTELDHKVSKLYARGRGDHVVTCSRRGIAAMAATMVEAARRR